MNSRMMNRPYDSIPRQGKHLGRKVDEEPSTNVRAPNAPKLSPDAEVGVLQLSHSEERGHYRIRRWENEDDVRLEEGYKEIRRLPAGETLETIYEALPAGDRFFVLENAETGETYFDRDRALADHWTDEDRFDQATIFSAEEAAASYASARTDPPS